MSYLSWDQMCDLGLHLNSSSIFQEAKGFKLIVGTGPHKYWRHSFGSPSFFILHSSELDFTSTHFI